MLDQIPSLPYPLEWVLDKLIFYWPSLISCWTFSAAHFVYKAGGLPPLKEVVGFALIVGTCGWILWHAMDKGYAVG